MSRPANLTDCYRLIAAICIVWLHSSFVLKLPPLQQTLISQAQVLFLSWALPFFYFTTAEFSLLSVYKHADILYSWSRVKKFIVLILFHSVVMFSLMMTGQFLAGNFSRLENWLGWYFYSLKYGNPSAVIFLFHALLIYLAAHLVQKLGQLVSLKIVKCLLVIGMILTWFFCYQLPLIFRATGLTISLTSWVGMMVGFIVTLLPFSYFSPAKKVLTMPMLLAVVVLPMLMSGLPYLLWPQALPLQVAALILLGITLHGLRRIFAHLSGALAQRLSQWGQEYSLGIFLLHGPIMKTIDWLMTKLLAANDGGSELLGVWLAINLLTLGLTLVMVVLVAHSPLRTLITLQTVAEQKK
ncbi:MAG TPA: hypothetical protein VD999_04060 [Vitreimonas sp.]|nr:hypothetical protein [Vitreimonas sp.]